MRLNDHRFFPLSPRGASRRPGTVVGALALALAAGVALSITACSDDATPNPSGGGSGNPTAGSGAGGMAGTTAMAGTNAGGTASGSGGAGAMTGGAGTGGANGGAGAGGTAGSSGAGGTSGGGAGGGGSGGMAGGAGGTGGAGNCMGNAVSFNSNTAAGNDPAKSVVVVNFNGSTDLPTGNTQRTIEFWAYVLSSSWAGDVNTMFFYGTNNRMADGFGLDFGGQKGTIDPFTNAIFDNDNQATGLDASKDQWVHFAMTWDGMAVRAFVNGVQKAMKVSDQNQKVLMTGMSPLYIGTYGSDYFNGKIDEFRVWNINRSEADIKATMNHTLVGNEAGLVGYWKFDETSGTTAKDSVTTAGHMAHDGMLQAASQAQLPTWVPGAPLTCP